jgi:hypothetical protein
MVKHANSDWLAALQHAKPVSKADIPQTSRGGVVKTLPEFKDVVTIAKAVKEHGVGAYEAFDIVDFDALKRNNKEAAKLKTLVFSFVTATRNVLRQFQVEKKLLIRQRANKLFLVSADTE